MHYKKTMAIREAMRGIDRQFPNHPSTFGPCANNCGSGMSARGSGKCFHCYRAELEELTNPTWANRYGRIVSHKRNLTKQMIDVYGDTQTCRE